jgi:Na+/H+ antiporter NhaA
MPGSAFQASAQKHCCIPCRSVLPRVFSSASSSVYFFAARLPYGCVLRGCEGASWGGLYGVSVLSGIGFTMSLFIAGLAFEDRAIDTEMLFDERLGILLGSGLSGVVGYLVLHRVLPRQA